MKLVLEFTKTGNMIYISHLDLMRLFLRVLRMAGLRPAYSQGFNPHPKMSFALPLALGVHSVCELLEFEIDDKELLYNRDVIANALGLANEKLPEGIRIKAWCEKPASVPKSLASYVSSATYEFMCDGIKDAPQKLESFFAGKNVIIKKTDKKTGAETDKDIREQMLGYKIVKDMRGRMLAEVTLAAAPGNTLSPAVFLNAFCGAFGYRSEELSPVITRVAILGGDIKHIYEKLEL